MEVVQVVVQVVHSEVQVVVVQVAEEQVAEISAAAQALEVAEVIIIDHLITIIITVEQELYITITKAQDIQA